MTRKRSAFRDACLPRCVLIANRGEIALRIARTARRLGLEVLGAFSSVDGGLPHLRLCQRACELHGDPAKVYLDSGKILDAARHLGADAIHPGYGFLSENRAFAAAVEDAGLRFVGPTAEQIGSLGDKVAARLAARKAGVPTVPGTLEPLDDAREAAQAASKIGFPVLVKAAGGGGGRGMRVVENAAQLPESFARARSEAQAAFGDGRVFLERYFPRVRHVEIQVLGDGLGQAVSLGERDCSVQRRHQKLIEESPAPNLSETTALKMGEWAARLAAAANYRGAGTVEFLVPTGAGAKKDECYFIEMNTRLQVEHPVTELRTGIDLVEEQLRIAGGLGFSFKPEGMVPRGFAIEARVIAEDPDADFRPSLGTLATAFFPAGPGVRVDAWAEAGLEVSPYYDSLLAKVLAWGRTREEAIRRLQGALRETLLTPVITTAPFLANLIGEEPFFSGHYDTSLLAKPSPSQESALAGARKKERADSRLPTEAGVLAAAEKFLSNGAGRTPGVSLPGRGLSTWQAADPAREGG